jgi:hypothetical protein
VSQLLFKTSKGEEKHITQMTIKEVVELYLSDVVLDEEDDVYAQEMYWRYIYDAHMIKDLDKRKEYLDKLDVMIDFDYYNKHGRYKDVP